jgi:hypothetical protein
MGFFDSIFTIFLIGLLAVILVARIKGIHISTTNKDNNISDMATFSDPTFHYLSHNMHHNTYHHSDKIDD